MATIKTRSGRLIKRPSVVYVPDCENLVDDYASHEYDSDDDGSDIATDDEMYDSDDDQNPRAITIDEDADENGNLRGFVADSDEEEESDSEYYEEEEEEYETSDGEDDDYDDDVSDDEA